MYSKEKSTFRIHFPSKCHTVFFGGLFVCFSAILFLCHSICSPSILLIEERWMETSIEGENKRQRRKRRAEEVGEKRRGKRCQYVISLWDRTKREGRVALSVTLTHWVGVHMCKQCVCVSVCVCVCVCGFTYSLFSCTVALCSIDP